MTGVDGDAFDGLGNVFACGPALQSASTADDVDFGVGSIHIGLPFKVPLMVLDKVIFFGCGGGATGLAFALGALVLRDVGTSTVLAALNTLLRPVDSDMESSHIPSNPAPFAVANGDDFSSMTASPAPPN